VSCTGAARSPRGSRHVRGDGTECAMIADSRIDRQSAHPRDGPGSPRLWPPRRVATLPQAFPPHGDAINGFARICLAALLGLAFVAPATAAPDRRPLQVQLGLKGAPKSEAPSPIPGAQERSVALVVQDGRGADAGAVIGQAVDDGVVVYPIFATNDVRSYVED